MTQQLKNRLTIRPVDRYPVVLTHELLAAKLADGVFAIFGRVAIAGACYPIVLSGFLIVASIIRQLIWADTRDLAFDMTGGVLATSTIGTIIGFFWAAMVGAVVLPVIVVVVRSLRLRGNIVWLAAFSGGLVGFIAVLPMMLFWIFSANQTFSEFAIALMLGPGLTTILGQIGGAWGGWRAGWYERAVRASVCETNGSEGNAYASTDDRPATKHFQFGIWHLLVISFWASLLLAAIRLSGFEFSFALTLFAGWLVYQTATLWLGGVIVGGIVRWRAKRKTRST